jgi:hypothetical protein
MQINFTRTSPLGLGDAKFTLIHWRNCLEELVPGVKESTRQRDQPDPAAREALASRGRSRRRRRRERGSGVEELALRAVHLDAPFLYGRTVGPDYPAYVWPGYSSPWIIQPKSGPDNPAWNSSAQEKLERNRTCVHREKCL